MQTPRSVAKLTNCFLLDFLINVAETSYNVMFYVHVFLINSKLTSRITRTQKNLVVWFHVSMAL